jgi:hypothetical protein
MFVSFDPAAIVMEADTRVADAGAATTEHAFQSQLGVTEESRATPGPSNPAQTVNESISAYDPSLGRLPEKPSPYSKARAIMADRMPEVFPESVRKSWAGLKLRVSMGLTKKRVNRNLAKWQPKKATLPTAEDIERNRQERRQSRTKSLQLQKSDALKPVDRRRASEGGGGPAIWKGAGTSESSD